MKALLERMRVTRMTKVRKDEVRGMNNLLSIEFVGIM